MLQRRWTGSFVTTLKTGMKELRARNNLTREDLAEKVEYEEIIHFIEKRTCNPSLYTGL
jgi:DNA-binding XRE family transcriptional regulator